MRINVDKPIVGLDGKQLKSEGEIDLTFSLVACNALLVNHPDDARESGEQKAKRFNLALRLYGGGEQEISVEEASELKKLIARTYGPLVVGRCFEIIEGKVDA